MQAQQFATNAPNAQMTPQRNRCVESIIKEISTDLAETLNSSVNLADKLRGTIPSKEASANVPQPADVLSWLDFICMTIKEVNQQLSHAHNAISG